ncbi:hypothetical protein ES288_D03G129100v1 [Gossypium darwinii]|uniref:Uncharacterized protein n=1 Tax=Gossypium darwinii TaxID=34276 RepID=A0A5D2D6E2_GOSDA|nr:hypothetical protein ES288_D03G129100v1 [Gossypium darwinii]
MIAYNRTIRGVMSDRDRCSIPLLGLSSLLNVAPFLSSSISFHRDLLGVPRSSPFCQYTRLTVCIDTALQSQALNSGNPILKTYDIVAVDIISIDFSDKLPFRLKLPIVKAAIKRGIYFEITYSDLIVDVHQRRQIISNAKLLLDWTQGKNVILSSAAPSVCEVRGPNDVANLASLLGLSMERAKVAISKNCSLLTNALRRKHFFKEVIRVEAVSSSINLWNLEISNQSFNIVNVKRANMEDLTKVITSAELHPTHCNMLAYSSSKGSIRLIDLRQSTLCDSHPY